ncbi:MAG: hypothetical protein LEGION0398_MBIBDBAK_00824 [Legionellaceae bacterium]
MTMATKNNSPGVDVARDQNLFSNNTLTPSSDDNTESNATHVRSDTSNSYSGSDISEDLTTPVSEQEGKDETHSSITKHLSSNSLSADFSYNGGFFFHSEGKQTNLTALPNSNPNNDPESHTINI